jgi:hypothetical protein
MNYQLLLNCNKVHRAWLATYMGQHYKEYMTGVAYTLGFGKRKMDSISFHEMATAIDADVRQQRGINRHFNDWAGHIIFETDKALKYCITLCCTRHIRTCGRGRRVIGVL